MNNSLENLRKYFRETLKEKIKSDWEETKVYDDVNSPTIEEFLNSCNLASINKGEADSVCPDCGYKYEGTHDKGWHNKQMHGKDWQTDC